MKERLEKVKKHFRDNQKTYYACGGTAIVAVVGTAYVLCGRGDVTNAATAIGLWKPRAEIIKTTINLIERSTPSRPVHLKGTNLYFNSLHEAARETGHSLAMISRQVNGHIPDVGGDVFELLEPAA
jgi:hypothetical protein